MNLSTIISTLTSVIPGWSKMQLNILHAGNEKFRPGTRLLFYFLCLSTRAAGFLFSDI